MLAGICSPTLVVHATDNPSKLPELKTTVDIDTVLVHCWYAVLSCTTGTPSADAVLNVELGVRILPQMLTIVVQYYSYPVLAHK